MTKLRIMLVDDHVVLRTGLRMFLNSQNELEVVAEASRAGEILSLAASTTPDVVVLDLTLPDGGGLERIDALRRFPRPPHVLVLSMHDDPAYARAALAAGASGYIVKTVSEQELLTAVRTVARGRAFVDLDDEAKTARVFNVLDLEGRTRMTDVECRLSERERSVLRLLGRGFANCDIARQLEISPKTVATYRARLGDKLGLRTTAEFVRFAHDTGLLEQTA